jgi:5-formyltetrahydrofolate cyclo-ligase
MDTSDTGKSYLREQLKAVRAGLAPDDRREKSAAITATLCDMLLEYETVLVYASKEPEVDTHALIACLIDRGTRVVVPIIQREDFSLRFSYVTDLSCLRRSTFDVPEPIGSEIPADPDEIEVALIPLIGFDEQGNRLGYGAGYYDRFLETHLHIVKIGVGFACQRTGRIPANRFDIRMDFVVTEEGVISC